MSKLTAKFGRQGKNNCDAGARHTALSHCTQITEISERDLHSCSMLGQFTALQFLQMDRDRGTANWDNLVGIRPVI